MSLSCLVLRLVTIVALLTSLSFYAHAHELPGHAKAADNPIDFHGQAGPIEMRHDDSGHSHSKRGVEPPLHCGGYVTLPAVTTAEHPRLTESAKIRTCAPQLVAISQPTDPPPPRG